MPRSGPQKKKARQSEAAIKNEPSEVDSGANEILIKCDEHSINDCQFWCNDCSLAICMQCADGSHQKHHLQLLQNVLRTKLQESISQINHFRANRHYVVKGISECDDNIAYYKSCIEAAQRRKQEFKEIEYWMDCFYFSSQMKKFVDGKTESLSDIEGEILGKVLKILQKSDDQHLKGKSSPILIFGSVDSFNAIVLAACHSEISARIVFIEQPLHIFSFSCISATKWPVKVTIRLTLLQKDSKLSNSPLEVREKSEIESCAKTHCHTLNELVFKNVTEKEQIVCECDGSIDYFVIELTEH